MSGCHLDGRVMHEALPSVRRGSHGMNTYGSWDSDPTGSRTERRRRGTVKIPGDKLQEVKVKGILKTCMAPSNAYDSMILELKTQPVAEGHSSASLIYKLEMCAM